MLQSAADGSEVNDFTTQLLFQNGASSANYTTQAPQQYSATETEDIYSGYNGGLTFEVNTDSITNQNFEDKVYLSTTTDSTGKINDAIKSYQLRNSKIVIYPDNTSLDAYNGSELNLIIESSAGGGADRAISFDYLDTYFESSVQQSRSISQGIGGYSYQPIGSGIIELQFSSNLSEHLILQASCKA